MNSPSNVLGKAVGAALLALYAGAFASPLPGARAQDVEWEASLEAAIARATQDDKPLLVVFR